MADKGINYIARIERGTLGTLYKIHRAKLNQQFSLHAVITEKYFLATVALNDCKESMIVSRYLLVSCISCMLREWMK